MLAGVSRSFEKLKGTLTCTKCVEAAYFPEGRKRSCSFAGVAAFASSSLGSGSGTAMAPFILRARSSRMKKT